MGRGLYNFWACCPLRIKTGSMEARRGAFMMREFVSNSIPKRTEQWRLARTFPCFIVSPGFPILRAICATLAWNGWNRISIANRFIGHLENCIAFCAVIQNSGPPRSRDQRDPNTRSRRVGHTSRNKEGHHGGGGAVITLPWCGEGINHPIISRHIDKGDRGQRSMLITPIVTAPVVC
jgi:hypothetical protein